MEITKIEYRLIALTVLCFVLFMFCMAHLGRTLENIHQNGGIKSVVMSAWEGEKESETNDR